ncbi:hypothetical protein [Aquimarina agarilytica]|uniref:hypothetical protein n=1 Tax=Aquimarina agarilytica TaxID=1087449 RepID=UPI000287C0B1|nr:hypothetical protein [Aquimarina agarilytica]
MEISKGVIHFVILTVVLFVIHNFVLLPYMGLSNNVPVALQHLLLGGFSIVIFLVTQFVAKHFFSVVGFGVLGFLLLKMIFLAILINAYSVEIKAEPKIKYVLLAFYLIYLVFLLVKIIPVINITPTKNTPSDKN